MVEGQAQTISKDGRFHTTQWTVVLKAGQDGSAEACEAWEVLCKRYWQPLYVFARCKGLSVEMAEDLIQGFFEYLMSRNVLEGLQRGQGRFRSFLLQGLVFYLTKEWEKSRALKRGGDALIFSLDIDEGENRYHQETTTDQTPERAYERQWVATILERVLNRLRQECEELGKGKLFARIEDLLVGAGSEDSYTQVAQDMGLSPGAVRTWVYRCRNRYRAILRDEVLETVNRPEDVDEEIRNLLTVF